MEPMVFIKLVGAIAGFVGGVVTTIVNGATAVQIYNENKEIKVESEVAEPANEEN